MVELFEKKNGKFYVRDKELPTHINGKKVLNVTSIERNGTTHPFIELESDKPIVTIVDKKQTIRIRYIVNSKKNYCRLKGFTFYKDEWYIIDKETYLDSILEVEDNNFEININGEIIVVNEKHKYYIMDKLEGGE